MRPDERRVLKPPPLKVIVSRLIALHISLAINGSHLTGKHLMVKAFFLWRCRRNEHPPFMALMFPKFIFIRLKNCWSPDAVVRVSI